MISLIHWQEQKITFPWEYCQWHGQEPASVAPNPKKVQVGLVTHIETPTEGTMVLPQKYLNYAHVFKKKNAESLPWYWDSDFPIELQSGEKILFGRIYAISEPELTALKECL